MLVHMKLDVYCVCLILIFFAVLVMLSIEVQCPIIHLQLIKQELRVTIVGRNASLCSRNFMY